MVPHPLPTGLGMVLFCKRFTVVGVGTVKFTVVGTVGTFGVLVLPIVLPLGVCTRY